MIQSDFLFQLNFGIIHFVLNADVYKRRFVRNEIKKRNSNDVFNLWKSSKFSRILKGDSCQNITYFLKRKEVGNTRQCYRIQNIFTPHLQGKDWRNSCKKISNQNQFSTFYVLRFFFLLFSDRMSQLNEAETFSIHW